MIFRSAVVALALVAGLTACSGGDDASERTTSTSAGAPTSSTTASDSAPEESFPVVPIEWESCGRIECATVTAPLDHAAPAGSTVTLSVVRLPAEGDRIGSLFVNFGGPGSVSSSIVGTFPFPAQIRQRFDIVAVDPRGVGESVPLDCGLDPLELYHVDPTIEDDADAAALIDVSRRYGDDCAERHGAVLAHVGTRDVARDMDLVRAAMGDERLDFVGYSYGTAIGQVYAELFPGRVRTMILDGVVDTAPDGLQVAIDQAAGFETALRRWADGCTRRPTCPGDDPIAAIDTLLARAESGVPSASDDVDLGPGEMAIGLALPLYSTAMWPSLDRAVTSALGGDGSAMVGLARQYTEIVEFDAFYAVSCLDVGWPGSASELLAAAEEAGADAPHFGEALVNDYLRCINWPERPQPLGSITAAGAAPILVVSTTGDPATPYANGVTVADRLESAVLLTHEGDGHTIVFQGSDCVDRIAIAYLIDEQLPGDGTTC